MVLSGTFKNTATVCACVCAYEHPSSAISSAFESHFTGKCITWWVPLCFKGHMLEEFTTIFQEAPLEITDLNVCVCACRSSIWLHDVGGMVAQWLVLLPPRSLHVCPKFHREAHQGGLETQNAGECSHSLRIAALWWSNNPEVSPVFHLQLLNTEWKAGYKTH